MEGHLISLEKGVIMGWKIWLYFGYFNQTGSHSVTFTGGTLFEETGPFSSLNFYLLFMEIHTLSLISISSSWLNFFIMTKMPSVSVHFCSISLPSPKSLKYVPDRHNSFMTWKNTTFFPDSHALFRFSKFFLYCPKLIFEINYSSAISGLFHVFLPLSGKITLTEYLIVILSNTILFTGFSIIFSEFLKDSYYFK